MPTSTIRRKAPSSTDHVGDALSAQKGPSPLPPKLTQPQPVVPGVPFQFRAVVHFEDNENKNKKKKRSSFFGKDSSGMSQQRLMLVTSNSKAIVFLGPNGLIEKMIQPTELGDVKIDNNDGTVTIERTNDGKPADPVTMSFDEISPEDGTRQDIQPQLRSTKLAEFATVVRKEFPDVHMSLDPPLNLLEEEREQLRAADPAHEWLDGNQPPTPPAQILTVAEESEQMPVAKNPAIKEVKYRKEKVCSPEWHRSPRVPVPIMEPPSTRFVADGLMATHAYLQQIRLAQLVKTICSRQVRKHELRQRYGQRLLQ